MKRFYKLVSTQQSTDGFEILLDGKPVKTKSGAVLCAENQVIADEIMQEWAGQEEDIIPDAMPMTQILNTKQDRVASERAAMTATLLKYVDTDLLCYLASDPPALVSAQDDAWRPWREWFEEEFKVQLQTTTGLAALSQSQSVHDALSTYIAALDLTRFTIFQLVTSLCGSLVLGVAFMEGEADVQSVMQAAFVEERFKDGVYQADKYGADPMMEKKQKSTQIDLDACACYLAAL